MSAKPPKRWHLLTVAEFQWDRWGAGVECSFCHWVPPEISVYLYIGPVLLGIGVEEEWDYIDWKRDHASIQPASPPTPAGGTSA